MTNLEKIEKSAEDLGCKTEKNAVLKDRTTFKIGGSCDLLVHMNGEESFVRLIPLAERLGVPYYIFGKGSNLIVDSDGIEGVVFLSGKDHSGITVSEDRLFCDAGASLTAICNTALENSLTGLEFAYGIPGTLGGAVFMNAGAYGGEMKDVITAVKAMDKQGIITMYTQQSALDFSYRHSRFPESGEVILSAEITLKKGDRAKIKAKMEELMDKRRSKQPLEYPSAGSTFKRPEGNYAAALIEQCGLKGVRVGDAQVSEKHSGFIINRGSATFGELMELIDTVKAAVKEKTGYELECEPLIISDKKGW